MTEHSRIRSFFLDGTAGWLEALLNVGSANAKYAALVCHPHPLYGGTMHNKVVFQAMKALNGFGFPVLRFNFRGVGHSAGEHGNGVGEVEDVRAALEFLKHEFGLPIIFTGFSFGAAIGLRLACPDAAVEAIISLGTPISAEGRAYSYEFLSTCTKPKLFVSGEQDQYASTEELRRVVAELPEPKKMVFVPGDHFFAGHLDQMRQVLADWVSAMLLKEQGSTV